MYGREIDGREIRLGVSGKLIMNALLMYDRETESLWSQFLGKAVAGPLEGTELELVPSQLTDYGSWAALHPDTLVLDTHANRPIDDHYLRYYARPDAGIMGQENPDDRLLPKDLVLGIAGDVGQTAYDYRDLLKSPVVNHQFEGAPIVLAVNSDGGGMAIYRREADGRVLEFENADDETMTDTASNSLWDKASGRAVSGPMAGTQLEPFPYILSFWFAWSDYFPDTELYEPDGEGG